MLASVALLARTEWIPEDLMLGSQGVEDYCVCLLTRKEDTANLPGFSHFPGDAVSSMDIAIASDMDLDESDIAPTALRVAAMRSVFTETGAVLAEPPPPTYLREPTRDILRRDGPLAFLSSLIAWDGGNPRPHLTLCPFEDFLITPSSDDRVANVAESPSHFFVAEMPDAEELSWMRVSGSEYKDAGLSWMKPSHILQLVQEGRIKLPRPEHALIATLQRHLSRIDDLDSLLAEWKPIKLDASRL